MSLEKQLEQLKNVTIKPENPSFKGNLRKRLINEHMTMFDTKPSQDSMKDSRTWFDRVLLPLKMQSAFNLAVLFISSFLLVSVSAAYITGPDDLSTRIVNTLTNKESIRIFSNIEGATVYINGQSKGITPVTVGLSEGNYSLRLEKSGYGIYSDTLRISKEGEHEVFAQLLKHASENDTYAGWLNYNNEELDFAFNYPPDWQIQEKLTSESDRIDNLTVMVSDGEHGVTFTFNSTEDFELDTRADVASYKRDLEFNSFKQSRFIQFESDGNFITAGMTIDTDDSVPFSIAYRMQGTEQEVLSSSILKTLDNISSSLVIGEYDPSQVIASSAEDENENIKVDLAGEQEVAGLVEKDETTSETVVIDDTEVVLTSTYTNSLYGYTVAFPEDAWGISASRADYPLQDRGFDFETDGNEYTVARLRVRSDNAGSIVLLISKSGQPLYPADWNTCADPATTVSQVANYEIHTSNGEFGYQFCRDGKSIHKVNSKLNGELQYAFFWDTQSIDDIPSEKRSEVASIVSSFVFKPTIEKYVIDTIKYQYDEIDDIITFEYRYDWDVVDTELPCISRDGEEAVCDAVSIFSANGSHVMDIVEDGDVEMDTSYTSRTLNLGTRGGQLPFTEYLEQNCDENGLNCTSGSFVKGVYSNDNLSVIYYIQPSLSSNMSSLIGSLSVK